MTWLKIKSICQKTILKNYLSFWPPDLFLIHLQFPNLLRKNCCNMEYFPEAVWVIGSWLVTRFFDYVWLVFYFQNFYAKEEGGIENISLSFCRMKSAN